jgi:hypothetical protein
MTTEEKVARLIDLHIDLGNRWAKHHNEDYMMKREDFSNFELGHVIEVGKMLMVSFPTDNDFALNTLLGVFEGDDLAFAAQEIDTMWSELWAEDELRGTPEKPGSWNEGYNAGYKAYARELDEGER